MNRLRIPIEPMLAGLLLFVGCTDFHARHAGATESGAPPLVVVPDSRDAIHLNPDARRVHRGVMLQHLETVQQIVEALAEENFARAQGLAEGHLGFAVHREAMQRQRAEAFPPTYHDLAMAHHEAAEQLARIMPTRDLKVILPQLDQVLKACVACHLAFRVDGSAS
jgi:hypothetical protein